MLVGALAIPLALLAAAGAARWTPWIAAWNALGALDLIIAVTLGLTSAPGTPLRVFTDEPGTRAMTELPWVMVPAMLVPLFLLIHLAVATRLRSLASPVRAVATAH